MNGAYTRVSRTDQVEGISLDAQKAKIVTYCDLHGLALTRVYSPPLRAIPWLAKRSTRQRSYTQSWT